MAAISKVTKGKRIKVLLPITNANLNACSNVMVYTSRRNKTANVNVKKTIVYLQLITAKLHIENSKNN